MCAEQPDNGLTTARMVLQSAGLDSADVMRPGQGHHSSVRPPSAPATRPQSASACLVDAPAPTASRLPERCQTDTA